MAFLKKEWKKRIVEFPGRRKLYATSDAGTYDVTREEGTISQAGDGFTSENMNDLENRINQGFDESSPFYGAYNDFPDTGYSGRIYVDTSKSPRLMYTWDDELNDYVPTGGSGGGGGTETGLYEYQGETTPSGRPPDPFAKASDVGDISTLVTEDKSSVVSAINEIYGKMENGGTSQVRIATFPSTGWTESDGVYTQTVAVADLLETGNYTYMLPSNLQTEEYIQAYESIIDNSFGAGTFTLTVSSIPSVDLQIIIGGVQSDAPYAAASDLVQTNAAVAEVEQKADNNATEISEIQNKMQAYELINIANITTEYQTAELSKPLKDAAAYIVAVGSYSNVYQTICLIGTQLKSLSSTNTRILLYPTNSTFSVEIYFTDSNVMHYKASEASETFRIRIYEMYSFDYS